MIIIIKKTTHESKLSRGMDLKIRIEVQKIVQAETEI